MIIQQQITENKILLITSVILEFENNDNPYDFKKTVINDFLKYSSEFIDKSEEVLSIAREISQKRIKTKDASYLACAIYAKCDYFITTDDKLLRYRDERIRIISPVDFIMLEDVNT